MCEYTRKPILPRGKSRTKTVSPMLKWRLLAWESWQCFWFCCLLVTLCCSEKSGCRSDRCERNCLPMRSFAGETPVVVWGIVQYLREILVSSDPFLLFFRFSLSVWMARSARPLVEGWYGADLMCLMPLNFINVWNSSLVKTVPLSETMKSGMPWVSNIPLSFSVVRKMWLKQPQLHQAT